MHKIKESLPALAVIAVLLATWWLIVTETHSVIFPTPWQVVIPAVLPQIIVGMRIGLGVAWLVVVAAEMIALRSGLGYLIIDSRNAGNRYDLVIAGMIIIGLIGLMLDGVMRLLEGLKSVRWRYAH